MNYTHLFEALMLVCFGFSWPLNVSKAYRARTAKGMSLPFIVLIITGYVAGITAKIMNGQFNYVLAVYFLNLAIVMTNMLVYFRNKGLDRKAEKSARRSLPVVEIKNNEGDKETMYNYTYSLDEVINKSADSAEKKNGVILMGGAIDKAIPVAQLANEYSFNFELYNKSEAGLTMSHAKEYFEKAVAPLAPEGLLIHLGENDALLAKTNPSAFDAYYTGLIMSVRSCNKNCRIALVSIDNPNNDKNIELMNAHIKAIAYAENLSYINLENAKLWHPESTKAACNFAHSMGLKTRKPLNDVAEILYSFAYHNLDGHFAEHLAG
jgi:hypothetical protein